MNPLQLTMIGFMSFRHEQTVQLSGMSMTAVTGPNGHGKSSIILAVAWALFGQTRVGGDRDSVVNDHTDQAEVILDFEDRNGSTWRVHRIKYWNGGQTVTLQHYDDESGQWISEEDHTIAHNQQKIYEITGLDEDTFYSLMAIEQNSIAGGTRFTGSNPTVRRTILMSLIPEVDVYRDELEGEAIDNHKTLKSNLDSNLTSLEDLTSSTESKSEEVKLIDQKISSWPTGQRESIEENRKRIESLTKLMDSENVGRAELRALLDAETSKRKMQESEAKRKVEKIGDQIADIRRLERSKDKVAKSVEELDEFISSSLEEVEEIAKSVEDKRKLIPELKKRVDSLLETQESSRSDLSRVKLRFEQNSASLEALQIQHSHNNGASCLVCESKLTEERLDELIHKAKVENNELSDELDEATSSDRAVTRKLNSARAELDDLDDEIVTEERSADRLEAKIKSSESRRSDEFAELKTLESKLEEMGDIDDLNSALEKANLELDGIIKSDDEIRLTNELEEMDESSDHASTIRQLKRQIRDDEDSIEELVSLESRRNTIQQQIDSNVELINSLKAENSELTHNIEVAGIVREACSEKGIPSMLIREILQSIEDRQNELLERITGDSSMTVEFRQERELKSRDGSKSVLDIIVKTPDGFERPIESFSGGERVRLTMSNLFAMVQVFNERTPGLIRTMWLDEPFGALDVNSLPIMVDIIRDAVEREIVDSVFVVTHQSEVSDAMPQTMQVFKDQESMSSVVEVI